MRRLYIMLTNYEYKTLARIAESESAVSSELLAAFVADLTNSKRAGVGDEQKFANKWLDRQFFRWAYGKMTTR